MASCYGDVWHGGDQERDYGREMFEMWLETGLLGRF